MIEPISVYGGLALSRVGMQIITSSIERKRKVQRSKLPKATLIVPCFNEPIEIFTEACLSYSQINYPDLEVIIVDDGSDNHDEIRTCSEKFGLTYFYQENAGKREAMFNGLNRARASSKVIMFSDSDTVWESDAAAHLVDTLFADEKTGGVTGEVAVLNHKENLITRLVGMRYHMAFAYERASQSFFKTVTCISGPLGAYRRDVIEAIKDDFINQSFMGKACTYGDDRHLTNLVLIAGYKVRYAARAKCFTQAPVTLKGLFKQQTRWGKSYWRELFWQVRAIGKHGWYLLYDFVITAILPFVLIGSVVYHLIIFANGSAQSGITLLATLVGMSLIRVLDPMIRKRDLWYMSFVAYSVIYFMFLLPIKLFALFTMTRGGWGTRKKAVDVIS